MEVVVTACEGPVDAGALFELIGDFIGRAEQAMEFNEAFKNKILLRLQLIHLPAKLRKNSKLIQVKSRAEKRAFDVSPPHLYVGGMNHLTEKLEAMVAALNGAPEGPPTKLPPSSMSCERK